MATAAPGTENSEAIALEAIGIHKTFGRTAALRGVDFRLRTGEIHAIVGQNGAGKSTLVKILSGVYPSDNGRIRVRGFDVRYRSPLEARAAGVSMVFQELSLVPSMTVAQNLFLTREPMAWPLLVDDRECERRASLTFAELGVSIDPRIRVELLSTGQRQMVEIAKALVQDSPIMIFDEPTASLARREIETLFAVMRRLKTRGYSIIYISHHLNEVMEVCDTVSVLRDGIVVFEGPVAGTDVGAVVTAMVGEELGELEWRGQPAADDDTPLLELRGVSAGDRVRNVSFALYPGEVLGLAGLFGSGRTELIRVLMGVDRAESGEILVAGSRVRIGGPADAIKLGLAIVPEDRRRQGILPGQSVSANMLLPIWDRLSRFRLINEGRARDAATRLIERLHIVATGPDQMIDDLSGGNQQKAVFGKALSADPKVLLLDEPTAGIDVLAKRQILEEVRRIARAGNGVVFVSSELAELAAACHRVLILHRGAVAGEFSRARGDEITEPLLLRAVQSPITQIAATAEPSAAN